MVMGGSRRGKKSDIFHLPESKIANEKSTNVPSSGFFHVKKRPGAS